MNEPTASEYLLINTIKQDLIDSKVTQDPVKIQQILTKYVGQSWFALFEITDEVISSPTPATGTGKTVTSSGALSSSGSKQ